MQSTCSDRVAKDATEKNHNLKCTQIVLVILRICLRLTLRGSVFYYIFADLLAVVVFFKRFLLDLMVILSINYSDGLDVHRCRFYLILLSYKVLVISGGPKVVTVTVHSKFSLVLVVMDVHKVFVG